MIHLDGSVSLPVVTPSIVTMVIHHSDLSFPSPPSNLLRPSGVRLTPSTLTIRVFRGEDLPQMDPGYFEGVKKLFRVGAVQKELVDPYCTVSFAGHKGKTKVIWNEQDPEWNTQINLGIRVGGWRCGYGCGHGFKVAVEEYVCNSLGRWLEVWLGVWPWFQSCSRGVHM